MTDFSRMSASWTYSQRRGATCTAQPATRRLGKLLTSCFAYGATGMRLH
ncbi:hypothetical protein ACN4D1_06615 [Corynebacterium macclintockiae]|uniref:Uncharacterized protein n=1 Tax=Corynebacterium macclintockiae TaxID=2913501 RepID=A0A9X3M7V6_9CORY|nr:MULTISPECIES: hypothetical protein [Corynebacterium]MCZ9305804.1 hypothetical protein [Corynebacterium macclintockiae]